MTCAGRRISLKRGCSARVAWPDGGRRGIHRCIAPPPPPFRGALSRMQRNPPAVDVPVGRLQGAASCGVRRRLFKSGPRPSPPGAVADGVNEVVPGDSLEDSLGCDSAFAGRGRCPTPRVRVTPPGPRGPDSGPAGTGPTATAGRVSLRRGVRPGRGGPGEGTDRAPWAPPWDFSATGMGTCSGGRVGVVASSEGCSG
jgi:hypothetical protein